MQCGKFYHSLKATYFLHLRGRQLCSHCHENVKSAIEISVYLNDAITFHIWQVLYPLWWISGILNKWLWLWLVPFLETFDYLFLTLVFFFWKICSSFCVNWLHTVTPVIRWYIMCLFTGRVDYIGSSHQWWHLFVVLALYYWHNTGIKYVEFRMNHGCATDMRLWQYGLHRFLCNSTCWSTLPIFMEEEFQRSGG